MKRKFLLLISSILIGHLATAQLAGLDISFDDANGTNLNATGTTGSESGSWNFGGPQVQSGSLNLGYPSYYKWGAIDASSGSVYRTFSLSNPLTSSDYSTYTFEVTLNKWDLRGNWDATYALADKGVTFRLLGQSGEEVMIGFEAAYANGFRAFSNGPGTTFSNVNGGGFDNALNRFEAAGGVLRITGDLTTGVWTALANDGEGGEFKEITSGTGITDIGSFGFFTESPSVGSWGGASAGAATDATSGGTNGDYILMDGISLTAVSSVPEPATFALFSGFLCFGSILWKRRRKA